MDGAAEKQADATALAFIKQQRKTKDTDKRGSPQRNLKSDIPNKPSAKDDVFDQIKKLADLKSQGLITEDEFQKKKSDLLGRL